MTTLNDLQRRKSHAEKFCCLTAYDATFARLLEQAGIEVLLVGDSLGSVIQGHDSTLPVTMADMIYHTRCVNRGRRDAYLIADMPFASYADPAQAVRHAAQLCQAGANAVKMEGGEWLAPAVALLRDCGIPVCGHLGLAPQSVNLLGGYRVQGKDPEGRQQIIRSAQALQAAGAVLMLLECVPSQLTADITAMLDIPVIGIGAGAHADAQVLVLHDLLGLNPNPARFVPDFSAAGAGALDIVSAYALAVREGRYPEPQHSYDG